MIKNFFRNILRYGQTVYSINDLRSPGVSADDLKSRINYYVKKGYLYHIRRGFYAKDKNYDRLELANKIFSPSYISFETVLASAGIIFQHYDQIFVATYQSKTVICDNQTYVFRRIKSEILTNAVGIEVNKYYSIATTERAFLDILYLNKDYHFANLKPLNWEKVYLILPIYKNKRMEKIVATYFSQNLKDDV